MSAHHDDEQTILTEALRERAEGMAGHSVGFDAVKGRARGIQRRRRAVTGVAAAAVFAVAVPVGLNLTDGMRNTAPPPAAPSPSVVRTEQPSPTPEPPKGPLPLDGSTATRGQDPAITYQVGSVVHLGDGSTVDLGASYDGLVPVDDGWLGYRFRTGKTYVMDSDGTVLSSQGGFGFALASDGIGLAYVTKATGGTDLTLTSTDGSRTPELTVTVATGGEVTPVGFVRDGQVAYSVTDDRGATDVFVTDFEGAPVRLDGLVNAGGASDAEGLISGMTSADDYGSCSAVMKVATQKLMWETCDFRLERISPDGRYVLGTDAYADGIGGSTAAILDATDGSVLAEYTTQQLDGFGFTNQLTWESDSTALQITHHNGSWYLLRLRPDGSLERALDPVEASEMDAPWGFATRP